MLHEGVKYTNGDFYSVPKEHGESMSASLLPETVDVLIVGSGPSGLTLATQLAQIPGIKVLLIEREPTKLQKGHADGLQVRSLETFQALGFAEAVIKEAYHVNEMTFWEPDGRGGIYRASRAKDTLEGTSEMPHVILTQALLHTHFLDRMATSVNPVFPCYRCVFKGFKKVADRPGAYNEVAIERTDDSGLANETIVHVKFVVGCDGARSAVREALALPMYGDRKNTTWGVMDAIADTDFPDIRLKVGIRSATEGAILIIPKAEREHMVSRVYAELDKGSSEATLDTIIAKVQKIFEPYRYDVKEVLWWSRYEIGQRICKQFDNTISEVPPPTIFIAGDACHTHSAKAGQGMNTGIADAFNLGWKLVAVVRGQADPDLLRTYSYERQAVAEEVIAFDQYLTRIFSSQSGCKDKDELRQAHADKAAFLAGTGIQYSPSQIQSEIDEGSQALATGFLVGKRFHSELVLRCADAFQMHLGHAMVADGRWRIVVFAGNDRSTDRNSRTWNLLQWLEEDPKSPIVRYTAADEDVDSVIEVLAVYRDSHTTCTICEVPGILWPRKAKYHGARDYKKIFTHWWDNGEDMPDIYRTRGIDQVKGAVVVVRPDQYVGMVCELDNMQGLECFFNGFMVER